MEYKKGEEISRGKTKSVFRVVGMPEFVILENRDDITAFDDPNYTKQFEKKAQYCTTTTCEVFEMLAMGGVEVAFEGQISPTSFVAPECTMIPLEVVVRRFAVGSYLKRHPEYIRTKSQKPYRFPSPLVEFFLKTNGGVVKKGDKSVDLKLDVQNGEEDPFIANPNQEKWLLCHSKEVCAEGMFLKTARVVRALDVVDDLAEIGEMEKMALRAFKILESAWDEQGCTLIDLKLEFGKDSFCNTLMIADVIDNDSWRLCDEKWNELSKQAFRDHGLSDNVISNYAFVAELAQRLRLPAKFF